MLDGTVYVYTQNTCSTETEYTKRGSNSTYIAWWLYLKHLVHKVRAHEKKIAAKSAEKKTHTKYPIKKEKGKKAAEAAATKPRKFWLCHIYTCCMAFLYRHVFVCTV